MRIGQGTGACPCRRKGEGGRGLRDLFFLRLWLNRIGKCKSVHFIISRKAILLTAGGFLKILYNKKTGTDRYSFVIFKKIIFGENLKNPVVFSP